MSKFQNVPRCDDCQKVCRTRVEDITRTPSQCVLAQASEINRDASTDEMDEKLNVWAALAPPVTASHDDYNGINLIALEKANALRNGKIVLDEKLNVESFYEEMVEHEAFNSDDDDDEDATNIQDFDDFDDSQ